MGKENGKTFRLPRLAFSATILFGLTTGIACGKDKEIPTDEDSPSPSPEEQIPIGNLRVLPIEGSAFLNNGAHTWDNSEEGILSSIDIAGLSVINCNEEKNIPYPQNAVAVATGTIVTVEDKNNPDDLDDHSIVGIQEDETGLIFEELHTGDIPDDIVEGARIEAGDVIGKPSCEVPPGGETSGKHEHLQVKDKDGNFISIIGLRIGGYTVGETTMTRDDGVVKNESDARCYTDDMCNGLRNDLVTPATTRDSNTPSPTPYEMDNPTPTVSFGVIGGKPR